MNFYFMFYQLTLAAERLEGWVKHLAANAFRTSPGEGQANRHHLERCGDMLQGAKELLNSKVHVSKVQLRRTAILFQALETAHRRVWGLAGAAVQDGGSPAVVGELLGQALRDYQALRAALSERAGVPLLMELPQVEKSRGLAETLRGESALQEEFLKLIEKAIEVFDGELDLAGQLAAVRKGLLEERKNVKRLLAGHSRQGETAIPLGHQLDAARN